jgi:hypothetical protein
MENKCWKKNLELIPDKVKAAWKKQAEKKAKKTSTTAIAFEDEDEMVLTVLDLQKDNIKFCCFDMKDALNMVLIDKEIMYLIDFEDNDDEEKRVMMSNLMTKRVTMRNLMTKKAFMRNLMTKKITATMTILLSQC